MAEAATQKAGLAGDLFERVFPRATVTHLSAAALNFYRRQNKIRAKADSAEFRHHLYEIGVLDGAGADAHLTGLGIILFGANPQQFVHQAGLNAVIHFTDGSDISEDFDTPAILIPDQLEVWLKTKIPDVDSRGQMVRKKVERLPHEAIREAAINAIVHRDYTSEDAARAFSQISINDDEIAVKSPGGPVPPVTLEELNTLRAGVYMRNPALTYYFVKNDLMERQNLGMKTFRRLPEGGYPPPTYSFEGGYLTMTIYRSVAAAAATLSRGVLLNRSQSSGWEFIVAQEAGKAVTASEYADELSLNIATGRRHLARFVELGWLTREGAGPSTVYRMVRR